MFSFAGSCDGWASDFGVVLVLSGGGLGLHEDRDTEART